MLKNELKELKGTEEYLVDEISKLIKVPPTRILRPGNNEIPDKAIAMWGPYAFFVDVDNKIKIMLLTGHRRFKKLGSQIIFEYGKEKVDLIICDGRYWHLGEIPKSWWD